MRRKNIDYHSPEAALFAGIWYDYRRMLRRVYRDEIRLSDAWKPHSMSLHNAWLALMNVLVPLHAYHVIDLLTDLRRARKEARLRKGGSIMTKAGTRRRKLLKRRQLVVYAKQIGKAEEAYKAAMQVANAQHTTIIILALAGYLSGGIPNRPIRKIGLKRFKGGKSIWSGTVHHRLRQAEKHGLLSRPK